MSVQEGLDLQCPCSDHRGQLNPVFSEGETDFLICQNCGLVFRVRFPSNAELENIYREAYCSEYIQGGNTGQESGDFAIRSYFRFLTSSVVFPGMRVLDFGSGSGGLVEEFRRKGISADGVEYSSSARAHCAQTRGFDLLAGHDQFEPSAYDLVTMIEVIEHVTDLPGTLRALYHALKPGGLLFVTTPNRKGLRARVQRGYWREARKKFHLFLFDWRSLFFHLQAAGFEDIRRLVFSPLQRPGGKFWLAARMMQTFGVSGTLCAIAQRSA